MAQGSNFKIDDDVGTSDQADAAVAVDASGKFVVVWEDNRNGEADVYGQRFTAAGAVQGVNFRVNDDVGTTRQSDPRVAVDAGGNFAVGWEDNRDGNYNVYAQRYNSSGAPQGVNFKVNDDVGTTSQYDPHLAMDGLGSFVVAWEDYRDTNWNIYAQRYNASGVAQGANFKVNDDAGTSSQYDVMAGMVEDGRFVLAWEDGRDGNYNIYAQRYNASGVGQGTNFLVNDDASGTNQRMPDIAVDGAGNFVLAWADYRSGTDYDIYARRYNALGTPLGASFLVNDEASGTDQSYPAIAMDGSSNFVVVWGDYRNVDEDVYGQRFDAAGNPLGSNFRVVDDIWGYDQASPRLAVAPGGDFVVTWDDGRNGDNDYYGQRYYADGSAWGPNVPLVLDQGLNPNQWGQSVAATDSQVVFCWDDARRSKDWDVYAKIASWDWQGVGVEQGIGNREQGIGTALGQNAPNPFSGHTTISFSLPREQRVLLGVYDVAGRRVRTLVESRQVSGTHQVAWDGKDSQGQLVANGVYLCRMEAGDFSQTRRMTVVR